MAAKDWMAIRTAEEVSVSARVTASAKSIRLALVDAHGFVCRAAASLGVSVETVRWYVHRTGLSALLLEWRRAAGWTGGRPRLSETRKRRNQRRWYQQRRANAARC